MPVNALSTGTWKLQVKQHSLTTQFDAVKVPEKPCQGGKGHGHMKAGKRKVCRFAFLNLLTVEDFAHHEFKLFHTNVATLTRPFSSAGRL